MRSTTSSVTVWMTEASALVSPASSQVVPSDPTESGLLVHSALPLQPCSSLDDAPILDSLRSVNSDLSEVLFGLENHLSLLSRKM